MRCGRKEKPMVTKLCLVESSAMDWNQKRNVLAQETIRRLTNTREDMPTTTKVQVLEDWIKKMKRSGYSVIQMREIVESGLKSYVRKSRKAKEEGRPMNRMGKETLKSRNIKKLKNKMTWFKEKKREEEEERGQEVQGGTGNKYERSGRHQGIKQQGKTEISVPVFVPTTAGDTLKRRLLEEEGKMQEMGFTTRVKVIEEAGPTLRTALHKAEHWANDPCEREDCYP